MSNKLIKSLSSASFTFQLVEKVIFLREISHLDVFLKRGWI